MVVEKAKTRSRKRERGAALVTVIMITVLLGLACVFMLKAAGAVAGESTDVLSETKAYYSAESGIQETLSVLRNVAAMDYNKAVTLSTANAAGDPSSVSRLSAYLPYTSTSDPKSRRVLSPDDYQAYSVQLFDPDETIKRNQYLTQMPSVTAAPTPGSTTSSTVAMTGIGSAAAPATVTFTAGQSGCIPLGTLRLTNGAGGGVPSATTVNYHIDYHVEIPPPDGATRSIYGTIDFAANGASATVKSNASGNTYSLAGSVITVWKDNGCSITPFKQGNDLVLAPNVDTSLYMKLTPMDPYRLKLVSTGYGPNGAEKTLECVVQRNIFNNLASGASLAMIGPSAGMVFNAGNSANVEYNGTDPTTGASVPSIGVTNTGALGVVTNPANWPNNPKTPPNPAPAVMTDSPDWQSSPSALDSYLNGPNGLKAAAQKDGTYYTTNPPSSVGTCVKDGSGNLIAVSGITYVDASYQLTGTNNCGILIVTGGADHSGGLVLKGNFGFTGLIIVTGASGVTRSGAGNGSIIGNIVIAPYNASTLATNTWLPPIYDMSGGGTSDVTYSGLSVDFDGQSSISDFVLGVAEK